jgi:hypothetical protein
MKFNHFGSGILPFAQGRAYVAGGQGARSDQAEIHYVPVNCRYGLSAFLNTNSLIVPFPLRLPASRGNTLRPCK